MFPGSYVLHLCEEYLLGGGFPAWAEEALGLRFTAAEFVGWNAFGLAMMCVAAWLVGSAPKFRFLEIALAVAVLGNVAAHATASLATWTYSPGLLTGAMVWLPLGVLRLRRVWRVPAQRERAAGLYLGIAVVIVTLAAVAARTIGAR